MKHRTVKTLQIKLYPSQEEKLTRITTGRSAEYIRELIDLDEEIIKDFLVQE